MTDQDNPSAKPLPTDRQRLSVVLCIYNEAHQIARCLDALTWADEVVVVDKFSTDETPDICKRYSNVRFLQREDWLNPNINFAIEQATGDWILRLDADEIVSPEMANEIQNDVLANRNVRFTGFWAPNRVYFFGKWIRYGVALDTRFKRPGYGYRQVLFRKGTAWYECKGLHEDLTTQGEYGRLNGHYEHYSHPSVTRWIAKMNHYTAVEAEIKDVLAPHYRLPKTGKTIAALIKIFFDYYIIRQGYRDGVHGFMTCALNTFYVLVERCKIWEKHYRLTHPDEVVKY